jgi:hypothetical protein
MHGDLPWRTNTSPVKSSTQELRRGSMKKEADILTLKEACHGLVVWHLLLIEETLVTSSGEMWKVLSYCVFTVTLFWQLHLQTLPLKVGVIPGSFCRLHLKWWSLDLFMSDFIKGCEFLVSLKLYLLENDSAPRRNFLNPNYKYPHSILSSMHRYK